MMQSCKEGPISGRGLNVGGRTRIEKMGVVREESEKAFPDTDVILDTEEQIKIHKSKTRTTLQEF